MLTVNCILSSLLSPVFAYICHWIPQVFTILLLFWRHSRLLSDAVSPWRFICLTRGGWRGGRQGKAYCMRLASPRRIAKWLESFELFVEGGDKNKGVRRGGEERRARRNRDVPSRCWGQTQTWHVQDSLNKEVKSGRSWFGGDEVMNGWPHLLWCMRTFYYQLWLIHRHRDKSRSDKHLSVF